MVSASLRVSLLDVASEVQEQIFAQLHNAAENVGCCTSADVLEATGLTSHESYSRAKAEFDQIRDSWMERFPELSLEISEMAKSILVRGVSSAW